LCLPHRWALIHRVSELLRIVVADDHPIFRAGLRQVLAADPRVEVMAEVADGMEALKQIRALKPRLAVLDFDLPGRNGLDVARELRRENHPTEVVILTAHREERLLEEALAAGVRGYLLKDNASTDLLQCLRTVAAGGTHVSSKFSGYLLQRGRRAQTFREQTPGLNALSPAERRVLRLIALNKTSREIAKALFLSPATVETHRKNICAKLELRGPNKLLQFAIEHRAELD
jgi:DNA-binding NarL/FixJ family response regulator